MSSTMNYNVPGCDSDEEVFWGPITAKEIELDWRRLKAQKKRFQREEEENSSKTNNHEVSITLTPIQQKIANSKDLPSHSTMSPRIIDGEGFVEVNLNISSPEQEIAGYNGTSASINQSNKNEADENKENIPVAFQESPPLEFPSRAIEEIISESSNDVSLYTELMLVDEDTKLQEISDETSNQENIDSPKNIPIDLSRKSLEVTIPEPPSNVHSYSEVMLVDKDLTSQGISDVTENEGKLVSLKNIPMDLSRKSLEGMIPEPPSDVKSCSEAMLGDNDSKSQEINNEKEINENIPVENSDSSIIESSSRALKEGITEPPYNASSYPDLILINKHTDLQQIINESKIKEKVLEPSEVSLLELSNRALAGIIPKSSNDVSLGNAFILFDKETKSQERNNGSVNKANVSVEYSEPGHIELSSRDLEIIPESSSNVILGNAFMSVDEEKKPLQNNDENENKENVPVEASGPHLIELSSSTLEKIIPESSNDVSLGNALILVEEETEPQENYDETENKGSVSIGPCEPGHIELSNRALEEIIPELSNNVSLGNIFMLVDKETHSQENKDVSENKENIPVEPSHHIELSRGALEAIIPESSNDVSLGNAFTLVHTETKPHENNDESENKETAPAEPSEPNCIELCSRALKLSEDISLNNEFMSVDEETKSQEINDVSLETNEIASELIDELKTKVESMDLSSSSIQVSNECFISSPERHPEVTSSGIVETFNEEQTDSSELSFVSLPGEKESAINKTEETIAYIPPDKKQKCNDPFQNQENVDPNRPLSRKSKIPTSGSSKLPILKPSSLKVERYVADTVWASEFKRKKIPKPKKPDYVVSPAKLEGLLKSTPLRPVPLQARPQSAGSLYQKPSSAPLQQSNRLFNTPNIPIKPSSAVSKLKTPTPIPKTPLKLKKDSPSPMTTPPKSQKYKDVQSPVAEYINSSKPVIIRNVTPCKAGLQMPQRILNNMETENIAPKTGITGIPQKYYSSASKVMVQSSPKKSPVQLRLGERQAAVLVTPKPQVFKHTGRVQSEEKKKVQISIVQDRPKSSRETSLLNTSFGTLHLSRNNELDMSVLEKQ